ncbi:nucleotide disphospho-sugar-binding domain-containing protein [Streptomyces canus]|uniref:nucleotide disphospho-sugar-binding domain-containing protein n=1 Tax=Streptomyces canus TaxID=58343 RepID=UPI0037F84A51
MARVIVAAIPVYGHFKPLQAIAADLVRRGHQVTFLTGSCFRQAVETTGAAFAPLPGNADYDIAELTSTAERLALPAGPARLDWDLRHVFFDPLPAQHQGIQRLLAEANGEPVVVLHDSNFLGMWPVLLGGPGLRPTATVGIGVTPLTLSSEDTAPFGLGLPPDSSEEGRARNRETNAAVREMLLAGPGAYLTEVMSDLGAVAPDFMMDGMVTLPDRFLQLCVESLEYPRHDAPPGLRYVGALPPSAAEPAAALPRWWSEVTAAERVVVVSQGTIANTDPGELIEPTLRALADLDVLVVATTGRADSDLKDVPANARVAAFIPFEDLLPHTDVLVSNGGYGGVQQALAHGVPMVLAGLSEDKVEVTARTAWTGAAINLATQHPAVPDIRKAVESVLALPAYVDCARRLQVEYATHDPFAEVAGTIDELLARRAG